MKKKFLAALMAAVMVFSMAGCGSSGDDNDAADQTDAQAEDGGSEEEETEIQVFIAASLNTVMTELADMYNEKSDRSHVVL